MESEPAVSASGSRRPVLVLRAEGTAPPPLPREAPRAGRGLGKSGVGGSVARRAGGLSTRGGRLWVAVVSSPPMWALKRGQATARGEAAKGPRFQ